MATTIITKNGSGAPVAGDLVQGELAVDLTNKEIYTKNSKGAVIKIGSPADGSGISDAPSDGKQYAREDAGWTEVVPATPTTSLPASAITDGAMAYVGSINITGNIAGTNLTAATSVTSSGKVKARDFVETVREPRYQGGTATLELDLANNFTMDFSAATGYVLGISGAPSASGDAYGCTLTLDTTNMDALVWDAKIKWSGGTAPTLTAGVTYVFTLITTDGGTTFKGFLGGEAFA